jgi:hypothetical protein
MMTATDGPTGAAELLARKRRENECVCRIGSITDDSEGQKASEELDDVSIGLDKRYEKAGARDETAATMRRGNLTFTTQIEELMDLANK